MAQEETLSPKIEVIRGEIAMDGLDMTVRSSMQKLN